MDAVITTDTEGRRERGDLRQLADVYESMLRVRIAAENRLRAKGQGADETTPDQRIASDDLIQNIVAGCEIAQARMLASFTTHPVYAWMMGVPGINKTMACRILGMIDDVTLFPRFSNLRTFAGLTPGKNKLTKGEKAVYSTRFKTSIYIAFGSMLKAAAIVGKNRPEQLYPDIYQRWRMIYTERYGTGNQKQCAKKKDGKDFQDITYSMPDEDAQKWPDLRQHFAAKNKMMDVFLYHVYEEWLTQLGLPVPGLYVHDVLGHHMKYDRAKFSSPAMAKTKR
jgi:hypothetical protein